MKSTYRPDIDGLRALAVLLVILFHLDPERVPGGYIGVDVFFVISGYLITQRILAHREAGTWSLLGFYAGRIRRLVPAATAVLALTLLASALTLDPGLMASTGQAGLSALFSVSNLYFWSSSGYFDVGAASRPLLHTWSLGVEEQFYLGWPVLLGLLMPRDRWRIFLPLLIAGSTLWAEQVIGRGEAETAFFLPQFRFAELGVGGLLGLWRSTRLEAASWLPPRAETAVLGFALGGLIALGLTLDEHTRFPGATALGVAVLSGAALVSGRAAGVGVVLVHPLAVFVGRVSYSAYLVHWPLIVFYRYIVHRPLNPLEMLLALPLILGLAHVLHRWVESPFRRPQAENGHRFYWSQAAVTLFLAGLFAWGWQSGGWPERVDELTKRYARARDEMGFRPCSSRNWNCKIGRPNAVERFLVVGDSHAKHLIFGIDQFARNRGWAVRILSENGCAPLPDIVTLRRGAVRKTCEASKGNISRAVESSPARLVLLSFGYLGYRGAFADARGQALEHDDDEAFARYWTTALEGAMDRWSRPGRKFAVVLPSFRPGFDPVECLARPAIIDRRSAGARCNLGPRSELESRTRALRGAFEALAKRRDLTLLDPNDALCRGERCRIEIDRILLFSDDHHLTMKGALTVIDAFSPSLEALLR